MDGQKSLCYTNEAHKEERGVQNVSVFEKNIGKR